MPHVDQELSWQVASHTARERSNDWYWGLGGLAVVGIIVSILFSNTLLAIIIALGAFSLGYLALQQPREHSISIGPRGIAVDGTRYPWRGVRSFWVEHSEHHPRLFVTMNGVLAPHISIYLGDTVEADSVRRTLKRHVPEVEQGPQLGEHLSDMLGLN
jgi:hypothetical protein